MAAVRERIVLKTAHQRIRSLFPCPRDDLSLLDTQFFSFILVCQEKEREIKGQGKLSTVVIIKKKKKIKVRFIEDECVRTKHFSNFLFFFDSQPLERNPLLCSHSFSFL
jgi:hypothetical protein